MQFGSWSYDITSIDMTPIPQTVDSKDYIENGQWDLLNLSTSRNSIKYEGFPNPFVDVTITLFIRRKSIYYSVTVVIPSAVLSGLVLLTFLLPPESGERVSLCITVLLAVTVFQQLTAKMMPKYQVPYLAEYYFVIIFVTSCSLIVTTFILNLYHRSTRRMPYLVRKVVLGVLAKLVFCCSNIEINWSSNETFRKANMQHMITSLGAPDRELISLVNGTPISKKISNTSTGKPNANTDEARQLHMTKSHDEAELRRHEWLKACRVLDRFFFLVFTLTFMIASLTVFLRAPRFRGH